MLTNKSALADSVTWSWLSLTVSSLKAAAGSSEQMTEFLQSVLVFSRTSRLHASKNNTRTNVHVDLLIGSVHHVGDDAEHLGCFPVTPVKAEVCSGRELS